MGRPKKTKTQKIKELVTEGKSVAFITKALKVSPSYVYQVRAKHLSKPKEAVPTTEVTEVVEVAEVAPAPRLTLWQRICSFIYFWR